MAESTEVVVTLGTGKRVEARIGRHVIRTDQPIEAGGEDTGPSPYNLFLASIAACAGFFVQRFCDSRGLATEGVRIVERTVADPDTRKLSRVEITVETPPSFPAKYRDAMVRAVDSCSVKRAIQAQPEITCTVGESGASKTAGGPSAAAA